MSTTNNPAVTMGPDPRTEEDPDNEKSPEHNLAMPQVMVAAGDESSDEDASEEEDEDLGGPEGDGYMLLPAGDQDTHQDEIEMLDDGGFDEGLSSHQQQQQQQQHQLSLPPHLAKLVPTETPAQDPSTVVSFTDTAKSLADRRQVMAADDEIKNAMAGFALPGSAIPPWARTLGDKEWKDQLSTMIQGRDEQRVETGTPPSKDEKA